jgi:uncharacterized damage-inducible protein DinB
MHHLARIQQIFNRHRHNRAWYGPTIGQLIEQVSAEKAMSRQPGGHSVWQILRHSILWRNIVCAALDGEPYSLPSDEQNWPEISELSEEAWGEACAEYHRSNEAIALLIAKLSEDKLDTYVDGQKFTVSEALHGILEHEAYHAGQIAILVQFLDRR